MEKGSREGSEEQGRLNGERAWFVEQKHILRPRALTHERQIQRPIIYAMLKKAGMPMRILKTYEKFREGLTAYNTITGGIREGYKKQPVCLKVIPCL